MTLNGAPAMKPRSFEAHFVLHLSIGNQDLARHRIHHHIKQDGTRVVERLDVGRRVVEGIRIESEDVVVGEFEGDREVPVPAQLVVPFSVVLSLRTIKPVSGAGPPAALSFGPGNPPGITKPGLPPKPGALQGAAAVNPSQTVRSGITVV
jgi:hypothetical protein